MRTEIEKTTKKATKQSITLPRAVPAPTAKAEPAAEKPRVTEELVIEEVSIDGMCGVY